MNVAVLHVMLTSTSIIGAGTIPVSMEPNDDFKPCAWCGQASHREVWLENGGCPECGKLGYVREWARPKLLPRSRRPAIIGRHRSHDHLEKNTGAAHMT